MSEPIKVGDKVRVSEDAPGIYSIWDDIEWTKVESYVVLTDDADVMIKHIVGDCEDGDWYYLPIPTKYLVKVDAEPKNEQKFKIGDLVKETVHPFRYGMVKTLCDGGTVIVETTDDDETIFFNHEDVFELLESSSEDRKPSEEIKADEFDYLREALDGDLGLPKGGYIPTSMIQLGEMDWQRYTADLAREIVMECVRQGSYSPEQAAEYAVKAAKAVVDNLKKK